MNTRNKVILVLVLILTIVVILALGIILYIKVLDVNKLKQLYDDVNNNNIVLDENPYNEEETRNVIDFLKTGTGIVYFEINNCNWCRKAKPIFETALKEIDFKIENIIYYNLYYIRENNTQEYKEMINILDPILSKDDNGNKKIFVPEVVFLKDGKIIGHKTNNVESYTDVNMDMTEQQIEELKNIYVTFMYRLKEVEPCNNCN